MKKEITLDGLWKLKDKILADKDSVVFLDIIKYGSFVSRARWYQNWLKYIPITKATVKA